VLSPNDPSLSAPVTNRSWITVSVIGIVLATFLSDFSHEMCTAVLPLYLSSLGLEPAALGLIEGVADFLVIMSKLAGGVDYRVIAADGHIVWLAMIARLRQPEHLSTLFCGVLLDIGDTIRAEMLQTLVSHGATICERGTITGAGDGAYTFRIPGTHQGGDRTARLSRATIGPGARTVAAGQAGVGGPPPIWSFYSENGRRAQSIAGLYPHARRRAESAGAARVRPGYSLGLVGRVHAPV
jgi:hypothetical protein